FLTGRQVQANNCFRLATLFLRENVVADDRERRPTRADAAAPYLAGRMSGPIGVDLAAAQTAIAPRPTKLPPVGSRRHKLHSRRLRRLRAFALHLLDAFLQEFVFRG